jgi:hypothetical protein
VVRHWVLLGDAGSEVIRAHLASGPATSLQGIFVNWHSFLLIVQPESLGGISAMIGDLGGPLGARIKTVLFVRWIMLTSRAASAACMSIHLEFCPSGSNALSEKNLL